MLIPLKPESDGYVWISCSVSFVWSWRQSMCSFVSGIKKQ
jgi:hypothetical protein